VLGVAFGGNDGKGNGAAAGVNGAAVRRGLPECGLLWFAIKGL